MGDRSIDVTKDRDTGSTDDLIEDTERLLSGDGVSRVDRGNGAGSDDVGGGDRRSSDNEIGSREPVSSDTKVESTSLVSRSLSGYFSVTSFLAISAVVTSLLFVFGSLLPFGGRPVGMVAAAFLVGLVTARRRYLEVIAAGAAVGSAGALVNFTLFAIAGFGLAVVGIGAGIGVLSCVVGYYFGRDLRDGLVRDIE